MYTNEVKLHVCIGAYIVPHFYAGGFSDSTRQHINVHLYSLNSRANVGEESG